jgi:hypothetical protein
MTISKRDAEQFKKAHCVKVFVEDAPRDGRPGKIGVGWRRVDALPLLGELDAVPDSPNRKDYVRPAQPYWKRERADGQKPQTSTNGASAPATKTTAASTEKRKTITDAQARALWAEVRKQNLSDDDVATKLRDHWHVSRTADIPADKYAEIMKWVKNAGD